jgi:hypothetical protein
MSKKTPTARVLAAKVLLQRINTNSPTREELIALYGSRVSETKRGKVLEAMQKLTKTLRRSAGRIVDKYENPPPPTEAQKARQAEQKGKPFGSKPNDTPPAGAPVGAT